MAKTLIIAKNISPVAYNANVTSYSILGINESGAEVTEANTKVPFGNAGVFSNLFLRVTANTVVGASVWRLRVNGANVNNSISIASSTTGKFEDTTNTDTIVLNDNVNYQLITGATGTSLSITTVSIIFNATGTTLSKFMGTSATAGTAYAIANANEFNWLTKATYSGTEANTKAKINTAGTWQRLYAYVSANARTNTTTFRGRKNGANGNQVLSVTSGSTGAFEDTTHTDTIAAGDLLNYSIATGTGTESITIQFISSELTTSNQKFATCFVVDGALSITADSFSSISPRQVESGITEQDISTETNIDNLNVSNLWCYTDTNTANGNTPVTFRKNQADTTLTVSITASTTGAFEDTTHTVSLINSDEITIKYTDNSSSGAVTLRTVTLLFYIAGVSPSASLSPSASTSRSLSPSASISPSASVSPSISPSASTSPSSSSSRSISPSSSASPSASLSPSSSISASISPSASSSRSLSPSASLSPSSSLSPSASVSASISPSSSLSPSISPSSSLSPSSSVSASISPSSSSSASISPSSSLSPSSSISASISPSASTSPSSSISSSISPSASRSPSASASASISPSASRSPSASVSASISPSASPSPSGPGFGAILKRWTGSAWIKAKLMTFTNGTFQNKTLKYWDGTSWVLVDVTG